MTTRVRKPRLRRRKRLLKAIEVAATDAGLAADSGWDDAWELNVILIGPRVMRRLNRTWLGHDWQTDVLAFRLADSPEAPGPAAPPATLGEVYVCPATAQVAAPQHGTSVSFEVVLYIVHGVLHLAGLDDRTASDREHMRNAEKRVLTSIRAQLEIDGIF